MSDAAATLLDPAKAEEFAVRLLSVLNDGMLNLMISIGHRTGLLDAMRDRPPMTSEEIAALAGLNERYVREWLGAMTAAGVVEVDADSKLFTLPPEHAAFLTRRAGADNMAVLTQYVSILGRVEDKIVECFRKGGGVHYGNFPRFHEVMAEDSGLSVVSSLESHILPLVPGLVGRLERGISALDVGCGSGRAVNRLAELFTNSRFTGLDFSQQAIRNARRDARARGLKNAKFVVKDLSDFDETAAPDAYDLITTFDAVHDQVKPLNVLVGIRRSLKQGGVYLLQEVRASSYVRNNISNPIVLSSTASPACTA